MAKFNWSSIESKINAVVNSDSFRSEVARAGGGAAASSAINAAKDFINEIINQIDKAGFSSGQRKVISNWVHNEPVVNSNGTVTITVSSEGGEGVSLYEKKYGSVNLIDVFSRGHTPSTYVYGIWHDEKIRSSLSLTYSDFVQGAINAFKGHKGAGYEVIDISRRD